MMSKDSESIENMRRNFPLGSIVVRKATGHRWRVVGYRSEGLIVTPAWGQLQLQACVSPESVTLESGSLRE